MWLPCGAMRIHTGKNDLTRRVTHREAVFGTVIYSIFDAWHCDVLWTWTLTRLLWYACDYVRLILYIMLHSTRNQTAKCTSLHGSKYALKYTPDCTRLYTPSLLDLRSQVSSQDALKHTPNCTRWHTPSLLDYTPPSSLPRRSQVHSEYAPKYTSEYVPKYTLEHAFKDAPNCTRWHTPSLLDCTLPSKLLRCSQVHSEYAPKYTSEYVLKYTPGHTLKDAPNCTRWHTPSLLGSTLPSTLSRGKTLPISLDYMLTCTLRHAWSRDLLSCSGQALGGISCRRQAPGGVRQVAYGGQCLAGGIW
jgi:hypothetical protein